MSMKDKVAIVAGGGRDIGRACALDLASKGANIVLTYHSSEETAQSAVKEIEALGVKAIAIKADLTDQVQVSMVVNKAIESMGKIDCLVHVSGGLVDRVKISEMSMSHWNKVMDVNLTSLFMMCHEVIPHMSTGSTIVTFASQAGRDGGGPGAVAYAASKGAVMTFTRGLAKELGPDIRVNSVCPGMIATGFHDTFTADQVRKNVAGATCAKREGTSEEVAKLVTFLASDASSYMTGNNVDINGGLLFS
ncbi:SDR family NAD(P)-dependent oxidoreductase [Thalassotalea sp. PS06]|uniref:SDR family NAD(P)-dependent oxidoreductase n=1 Tax=Thalassotalea sp. PS06 TaxID=2594005 RepID=UPI00116321B5|nr:SDR family NAD(P)-dependent oxidoreductase [Thalassotalea sp. PS06]QDO99901.1 SDR family oxidoreductase [Thalassotalea sp. PS06]